MDKLLLIDGSNLLFQMFYGMPARIVNRAGRAVHGTVGFLGALLKIVRMVNPTHLAVLFDGEYENERVAINADYKANRPDFSQIPAEETPFSQLSDIFAALDCLGIKYAETTVCETDDWIAGYALTYGKELEIVISSFDSDYFQLLTENVSVLRYRGERSAICTPDFITRKFAITPAQYADFKALVGDPSDNLKGAEKVGPKTAATLLEEFGTLENLLSNAESIGRAQIRDSILKGRERIESNFRLIKLSGGVSLPFSVEELVCDLKNASSRETLKKVGIFP